MKKEKLIEFIKDILKKHPPTNDKNIKQAYQQYQSIFHEVLKQEIVIFSEWIKAYRLKRKPESITNDILNALKFRPAKRVINDSGNIGRGGQRGLSKEWNLYRQAETILFRTADFLKEHKVTEIQPQDFLFQTHFGGTDKYTVHTRQVMTKCILILGHVNNKFLTALDFKNPKHQHAVKYFFGEDHPLVINQRKKGKHPVSVTTLRKAIKEVSEYIHSGKGHKEKKFYTERKFYYTAWLASLINIYMRFDNEIKKKAGIEKMQDILNQFLMEDKKELLKTLCINNLLPQDIKEISEAVNPKSAYHSLLGSHTF